MGGTSCNLDFKSVIYKRYVSEGFLVFKEKDHVRLFLRYLNNKHENINFTVYHELKGQVSFFHTVVLTAESSTLVLPTGTLE